MMATRFNYQILQQLGESIHSEIFKVYPLDEPEKIQVLRKIKPHFYSTDIKAYLQQQIEQLNDLSLAHIIIPSITQSDGDNLLLTQDFFSNYCLTDWLQQQQTLNIDVILTIAVSIVQCLETLHNAAHIHKGLKPNNILLNPDSLEIQLIDNVRVLDVNQLSHFIYQQQFCTHTLPYLSPEQTEKINYSVNYNTDLYAFGVILYETLTGKPPFLFEDPITILHSHLAEIPQRVDSINTAVPEILGDIIEQLLQKAPEKRYQTASGLKMDLTECLSQWTRDKTIEKFPLKRKDFSNRISIPSLMVGREDEKQSLLKEFEKTVAGVFRSALISGYSGIGKTRLIQELQLPIVSSHGYFCAGKFDQFQKNIPYSTLIQAFTYLIKTFLTEDNERQLYWRDLILTSLGQNARLITDLIPELELIIGKPANVTNLPPIEAHNRFNDTIGLFIACLAKKQHPLTFFIDDLQWCDSASFDVLEYIFANTADYPYLFWIGAYRHNEVDSHHRLTALIQKSQQLQRPLLQIRLDALALQDVNEMTAYILNTYPSRTSALSKVIFQTSVGNPLFVNEALRWLHTYKHLHLNAEGIWAWDDEQLRHTKIPESALDLFKDKIKKLPLSLQKLLGIAALLGARFEVQDLANTVNSSVTELYHQLTEVFVQNILIREKHHLLFFHDQVQAAAERLLDKNDKSQIHYQISMSLIKAIPEDAEYETLDNLFSIVEHLAAAKKPKSYGQAACFQEARFNDAAAKTSLRSFALESANYYFHQANKIYHHQDWEKHYDFLYSLYKSLARTEMALGHQDENQHILEALIQKSDNDLDKADCLYEQTISFSAAGDFKQGIKAANLGLDYFDKRIPEDNEQAMQKIDRFFVELEHSQRDIWQEILTVNAKNDRALQIQMDLNESLLSNYYMMGMLPQMYLSAIQNTEICLLIGGRENVSGSFAAMALYCESRQRFDLSLKFENVALAFIARYPEAFSSVEGMTSLLWVVSHNHETTTSTLIERCQQNITRGQHSGNRREAGYCYASYLWYLIIEGQDMQQISHIVLDCIDFSKKYNLPLSLGLGEGLLMSWSSLMRLDTPKFSETDISQKLKQWKTDNNMVSVAQYYLLTAMALYYLGKTQLSKENLQLAEPYLCNLSGTVLNRFWYVFHYLNAMQSESLNQEEYKTLSDYLHKVTAWVKRGILLTPYLNLMQAEHARFQNDLSQARRYYLDAIDSSHQQHYGFLKAFIQQRLGELYLSQHHRDATLYLQQALAGYQHCGADIKAQQITADYSIVISETLSASHRNDISLNQSEDVNYLLQASRQITQELDLNKLLTTIMKAIMERLGVQTGFLLIVENETLNLFAKAEKTETLTILLTSQDSMTTDTLSHAITHYVFRTKEQVLLNNAGEEGDFITDKVVIKQQLKSILCLPLLKQQKVLGILYLENHLVPAVFSPNQIEQTQLLTAQAAIALHNTLLMQEMKANHDQIAQFNKTLEQRITARTQELEDVNEELKNFAYVVSHDLKAPLRAINQISGWIEEDYADAFDDDGREQMSLLRNRAKRMHEMIDGILQYSRIGHTKILYESVDLNYLLADVVNIVVPPKHIILEIPDNLPTLTVDKVRLFQVLQNLLDNAVKYNDKKQGLIQFNCVETKHDWCFTIQDNGLGIAKEHQQKVFQLFQTLTTKDKNNSTGVGLSLIEKSINNWGGKISLESELGKGCQFTFTLPKKRNINE